MPSSRGEEQSVADAGRCCVCLVATAMVLELPPSGSSYAPTSCLWNAPG